MLLARHSHADYQDMRTKRIYQRDDFTVFRAFRPVVEVPMVRLDIEPRVFAFEYHLRFLSDPWPAPQEKYPPAGPLRPGHEGPHQIDEGHPLVPGKRVPKQAGEEDERHAVDVGELRLRIEFSEFRVALEKVNAVEVMVRNDPPLPLSDCLGDYLLQLWHGQRVDLYIK